MAEKRGSGRGAEEAASAPLGDANLPAWMTPGQVLAWIDRRVLVPPEAWFEAFRAERSQDWRVQIEDGRLAAALDQLAGRQGTVEPVRHDVLPFDYEQHAADITHTTGLEPGALADALRKDMKEEREASQRLDAARSRLREAMSSGKVRAVGRRVAKLGDTDDGEPPTPIPPKAFVDPRVDIHPDPSGDAVQSPFGGWIGSEDGPSSWVQVRFAGELIAANWPSTPPGNAAGSSARVRSPALAPIPNGHLRAWYRLRVARWQEDEPPPSARDDLEAARRDLKAGISRQSIRAVRREFAPEHWRKSGPRHG